MKFAEFDLLENKVEGLLSLHRDLAAENRRLTGELASVREELAVLREEREQTLVLKQAIIERLDRLLKEWDDHAR